MRDHSNPLSRPYPVRLAEQGFVHVVALPMSIEPYNLDDVHWWLNDRGKKVKVDYIISDWKLYFKDRDIALMFALRWGTA